MNEPSSLLLAISEQTVRIKDTAEGLIRQLPLEVQCGLWDQTTPVSPSMRRALGDFTQALVAATTDTDELFSRLCLWMEKHPEAELLFSLDEALSSYSLLRRSVGDAMNEATTLGLHRESQEENLFPLLRTLRALCQNAEDFSLLLRSTLEQAKTV